MNYKKSLVINMIASIVTFLINGGVSFLLTPYLVHLLGNEAYGFIGLSNDFVSYASILTISLNSMAARFITIEMHKKNTDKANIYFNSVLIANIIMAIALAIISAIVVINLNKIINISPQLVGDVKITFALSFINFIIGILISVFGIATFVKNRLDITSIRNIITNILRVIVIIVLFNMFKPRLFYILIAALVSTVVIAFTDIYFTKRLLPELKLKIQMFKLKAIKVLISSGIWNSINSLSSVLLTGVDLVIANIFIGGEEMGILSIAKTIPTQIVILLSTISSVFVPHFTALYAENDINGLVKEVKFSMKVLTFIMTVPITGFIVFGTEFYSLWMPEKPVNEIQMIQILSVLTLLPNIISSYIFTLYSINTVTNKLKVPVTLTLVLSIISTIIVFILLKTTNLGIYAIAGVSSIIMLLRVIFFVPIYAACNLKVKKRTFYKTLLKSLLCFVLLFILYIIVKCNIKINTWLQLFGIGIILGLIGYGLNVVIIFTKAERNKIANIIKNKIKMRG